MAIERALISVYDKTGIVDFCAGSRRAGHWKLSRRAAQRSCCERRVFPWCGMFPISPAGRKCLVAG